MIDLLPEHLACRIEPEPNSGCWIWIGCRNVKGYGNVYGVMAHRYIYTMLVGAVPRELVMDHLCANRACVNPAHLEPVTNYENLLRSPNYHIAKTHCPQGHPYSGDNLMLQHHGKNRICRTCDRARCSRKRQKPEYKAYMAAYHRARRLAKKVQ